MLQETSMQTKILDGNKVKHSVLERLQKQIVEIKAEKNITPGLAVILVGDNPASKAYVGMKKKACEQIGVRSFEYKLPDSVTKNELMSLITSLNNDDAVHGILLQLPLPDHLDENMFLNAISPEKDVDGFHPVNVGKLLLGLPTFKSCTPYGVCELMSYYDIDPAGKHVVIIGRSNIVGKPLGAMLVQKASPGNATVTICHSRTADLPSVTRQADILIAAIGVPHFVTPTMVKEGAIVIDVGINRVDDHTLEKGYKLVGDVDYDAVAPKTSAITPVPGGVGPLTIAMLMTNTLNAALNK